jgi:hypothetical protein
MFSQSHVFNNREEFRNLKDWTSRKDYELAPIEASSLCRVDFGVLGAQLASAIHIPPEVA